MSDYRQSCEKLTLKACFTPFFFPTTGVCNLGMSPVCGWVGVWEFVVDRPYLACFAACAGV